MPGQGDAADAHYDGLPSQPSYDSGGTWRCWPRPTAFCNPKPQVPILLAQVFCTTRRLSVLRSVRIPVVFDDYRFPSGGEAPGDLWSEKSFANVSEVARK